MLAASFARAQRAQRRPSATAARALCIAALLIAATTLVGGARPSVQAASAEPLTVHLVFGNHLDVGFWVPSRRSGSDADVLGAYFSEFLPRAVRVADELRHVAARGSGGGNGNSSDANDSAPAAYVYTTHAWLLAMFFRCPARLGVACPSAHVKAAVARGIREGSITWHAHPHNAQYELYNQWLFNEATRLTRALDAQFGRRNKTVAILRDVPGITRGAIPLLRAAGVRSLSLGTNTASAPPGVPKYTPFFWTAPPADSGDDDHNGSAPPPLLVFVHPNGYGGITRRPRPQAPPASSIQGQEKRQQQRVRANDGGGEQYEELFLDPKEQCIAAKGLAHVMCTSWRNDNEGPAASAEEVLTIFELTRAAFPGAKVVASTFEAFSDAVWDAVDEGSVTLPTVAGEIGDTWVFGAASDARKAARYRSAARAAAACAATAANGSSPSAGPSVVGGANPSPCAPGAPGWDEFVALLLKVPEHTWGADVKHVLNDTALYAGDAFRRCARAPPDDEEEGFDEGARNQARRALSSTSSSTSNGCPNFDALAATWARQAAYVNWALEALPPGHPVRAAVARDDEARGAALPPAASEGGAAAAHAPWPGAEPLAVALAPRDSSSSAAARRRFSCRAWDLDVGAGGVVGLARRWRSDGSSGGGGGTRGVDWAAGSNDDDNTDGALPDSQLGVPLYTTYSEDTYARVIERYAYYSPPSAIPAWFWQDFGRANLSATWALELPELAAKLTGAWSLGTGGKDASGDNSQGGGGFDLAFRYGWPRALAKRAGAPRAAWVRWACGGTDDGDGNNDQEDALRVTLAWASKRPTRIPEAISLRFRPASTAADPDSWRLTKLGARVAARGEVIVNGSHALHAVDDSGGVTACSRGGRERLRLRSLDAPLAAAGRLQVLPAIRGDPDMKRGVAFNAFNNMWSTNYPLWSPFYDPSLPQSREGRAATAGGAAFRFVISAEHPPGGCRGDRGGGGGGNGVGAVSESSSSGSSSSSNAKHQHNRWQGAAARRKWEEH